MMAMEVELDRARELANAASVVVAATALSASVPPSDQVVRSLSADELDSANALDAVVAPPSVAQDPAAAAAAAAAAAVAAVAARRRHRPPDPGNLDIVHQADFASASDLPRSATTASFSVSSSISVATAPPAVPQPPPPSRLFRRAPRKERRSLLRRIRNVFKTKAQDVRASLRFDNGAFGRFSRRRGETGAASRRAARGSSSSSSNLRDERFGPRLGRHGDPNGTNTLGPNDGQPNGKKTKRRRGENPFRGLPKRVFSSPPNLSGRFPLLSGRRKLNSIVRTPAEEPESDGVRRLRNPLNERGPYSLRGSMNLTNSILAHSPPPDKNATNFRRVLEGAVAGKVSFKALLDCMFVLEERLNAEIKEMLIKYLSRHENMEKLISMLTVVVPSGKDEEVEEIPGTNRVRYRYSYVSSMLLSNGPIQLRRILFLNSNYLDRLVSVLGVGTPTDPVVVRSVCKVLLSVLRDSPEDTVRAMVRRKDFMKALLSHIAVTGCPEVCLSMLSTVRCQAELKFGSPNRPIVGIMADARLQEKLCAKLAESAEKGPLDGNASATIENCSRVIVGIALRALVIPKFDINEDDADAEYMTKFNAELATLDVFQNPEPVLGLVDAGLRAIKMHDDRGYALSTALTAVRYLLVTVINGQESSLAGIRMQLLTVSTAAYETGICARLPKLAEVLSTARKNATVVTMWDSIGAPLGVVRLKILELLVVLQQHGKAQMTQAMVDCNIPAILLGLFKRLTLNSLLLHFVATIVEQSFRSPYGALRRAFLIDNNLLDELMGWWASSREREESRNRTPVADQGELLRMAVAANGFLQEEMAEVEELRKEIGPEKIAEFTRFCEGEVAERLNLNTQLLGGMDHLPPRNDDGPSFEDMPGFGGSEGELYFRSRGGGPGLPLS